MVVQNSITTFIRDGLLLFLITLFYSVPFSANAKLCEGNQSKQVALGSIILKDRYSSTNLWGYLCDYRDIRTSQEITTYDFPTFHAGVDYQPTSSDSYAPIYSPVSGMLYDGLTDGNLIGLSMVLVPDNLIIEQNVRIIFLHTNPDASKYNTHVNAGEQIGTVHSCCNHVHVAVRTNYTGLQGVGRALSCGGSGNLCDTKDEVAALTIDPGFLAAGAAPVSVEYFRRRDDPIIASNQSGENNFDAQFGLKNNDSSPVTIDNMAIDILKDGERLFACWVKDSSTTIQPGDTYGSGIQYCEIYNSGNYSAEVRLQIEGNWASHGTPQYFTVSDQLSGITVYDFWPRVAPIQPGIQNNFDAQFKITNNDSSSVTIQNMAIDILKDGVRQTACWVKNSSTTLSENESYESGIHYCTLDIPGSYSTEIRLQIDNNWKTYGNTLYFEVTEQQSEGRVDVYSGVTLSPSYITVGQNYDITFQLKEFQGGIKDLYGVEVWKQDANGNDIERIKKWFDSGDTDFSPYEVKSYTVSGDSDAPIGTAGWYKIAIKGRVGVDGEDRFTFGVVSGSNGANPVNFEVHGGSSQQPDLVVQSPSVDDNTLSPNEDFKIFATVRNAGSGSSDTTTLRYYLSTDSAISTSDSEIGTDNVDALSAGASSPEDKSNRDAPSTPGTYWVGACVDPVSGESNTGNNCSSGVQITVAEEPVNTLPTGNVESGNCTSVEGWAKDPDTANAISVHVYAADNSDGDNKIYVGSLLSDIDRSDVGRHGFKFIIPKSLKDGSVSTLFFYAINQPAGTNVEIGYWQICCGNSKGEIFPVYRFYSSTVTGHFYTISEAEKDSLGPSSSWKYEGVAWYAHKAAVGDAVPVYRFWSSSDTGKGHFFTVSESEKAKLEADAKWQYEKIAYYAYTYSRLGTLPVHRFYSQPSTDHYFTISQDVIVSNSSCSSGKALKNHTSFCYEGIAWYAYPDLPQSSFFPAINLLLLKKQ
ncbi:MAG: hypothetical protein D3915_01385 [Candidatus Electrothrix sp. AU1_5]|nr:hypothetical protein [Candidatus Electrothrix gigas]